MENIFSLILVKVSRYGVAAYCCAFGLPDQEQSLCGDRVCDVSLKLGLPLPSKWEERKGHKQNGSMYFVSKDTLVHFLCAYRCWFDWWKCSNFAVFCFFLLFIPSQARKSTPGPCSDWLRSSSLCQVWWLILCLGLYNNLFPSTFFLCLIPSSGIFSLGLTWITSKQEWVLWWLKFQAWCCTAPFVRWR